MAGKPVGTMFAEMDLDLTPFEKKLKLAYNKSIEGTQKFEQEFKNLGIKSDRMFESQKQAAIASYEGIKKHATSTAQDIVRAEQAKNEKLKQLNEQQFGHQKTFLGDLKQHWVAYGAAAVAVGMAIRKVYSAVSQFAEEAVAAANVQEAAEAKLGAVIRATGGAAGYSLEQMKAMAASMQGVTTVGDELIMGSMAILATFKNLRGEGFERATKAALDMSEVLGQDAKSAAIMLGKALNDPVLGLTALGRSGIQFTESQKSVIKAMVETGDVAGAQNLILRELETQMGGAAEAARKTFGGAMKAAKNDLGDMKEEIGFVITKNQFLADVVLIASNQFKEWGQYIKDNREYLMELVKGGILYVVDGLVTALEVMRGFHNAWLGIKLVGTAAFQAIGFAMEGLMTGLRFALAPLDKIFLGLVQIGALDVNPFDSLHGFGQFRASSADVTAGVLADIDKTNKGYDTVISTVKGWQAKIKEVPVTSAAAAKEILISAEKLSNDTVELTEKQKAAQVKSAEAQIKLEEEIRNESKKIWLGMAKFEEQQDAEREKAMKDMAAAEIKINREVSAEWVKIINAETKFEEEEEKERNDILKKYAAEDKKRAEKAADDEKKAAADKLDAYRSLYKDLKKYGGEYFDFQVDTLKKELAAYEKTLIDENTSTADALKIRKLLQAKYTEELKRLDIQKLKSSDNFMDGVKAGYLEMETNAKTFGTAGYEIFNTFANESKKAVSDILFEGIKTGTVDVQAVWETFSDAMLRKFTDIIGEMVINAAAKKILMWFEAAWTAASTKVLDIIVDLWDFGKGLISGSGGDGGTGSAASGGDIYGGGSLYGAYGGWVPGMASGGNSYANDKVNARLSPGEYVVDRERVAAMGQGGDTILAHINAQEAALLKVLGGSGTINPRTGLPQYYITPEQDMAQYYKEVNAYNAWWGSDGSGEDVPYGYVAPPNFQQWLVGTQYPPTLPYSQALGIKAAQRGYLIVPIGPEPGDKWYGLEPGTKIDVDPQGWFKTPGDWPNYPMGNSGTVYGPGSYLNLISNNLLPPGATLGSMYDGDFPRKQGTPNIQNFGAWSIPFGVKALFAYGMGSGAPSSSVGNAWDAAPILADMGGNAAYNTAIQYGTTAANLAYAYGYASSYMSSLGSVMPDVIKSPLKNYLKNYVGKAIMTGVKGLLYGGGSGGGLDYSFAGAEGDLSWLSDGMGKIAPQTTPFEFGLAGGYPARDGLSYVPRDNFPALLHQGEGVLTKKENKEWQGGSTRGGVVVNFNLTGTVIDRKAVDEFAEKIYPRLQKLQAWGH